MSVVPVVSIIVPAYNPGEYIGRALASVLAQTFTDWELILVDDGSTEDLSPFAHIHPAIRLIRQDNQGLSAARNRGIAEARGDYIAFLDADDVWMPDKLRQQVSLMREDSRIGLCHTQFDFINAEGMPTGSGFGGGMQSYEELLVGCGIGVSTVIVSRACLEACGLFDLNYHSVQDYELWLRIARRYAIVGLPESLAQYRIHGQNMSARYQTMYSEARRILEHHASLARQDNNLKALSAIHRGLREIRMVYGRQGYAQCCASLRNRQFAAFATHFQSSLRIAPGVVASCAWRHVLRLAGYSGKSRR